MTWDVEVLEVLADGYDVHYGARSIKHEVSFTEESENNLKRLLKTHKKKHVQIHLWSSHTKNCPFNQIVTFQKPFI